RLGVPDNCVNLTNQTSLLQLVWVLRAAAFTISVDSGPMHIAAAVSDNLLSIHTWTDPARVGPYNRAAWIWKNGEVKRVRELVGAIGGKKGRSFRAGDIGAVLEALREARVLPA
ncbi:MAG TPA: glycosyltransferase family 9 protein, partial [Chthoniobacterales bacterium]|nr:glycosyltransferase family 9 protein [Chthoniobacterales bacterium]